MSHYERTVFVKDGDTDNGIFMASSNKKFGFVMTDTPTLPQTPDIPLIYTRRQLAKLTNCQSYKTDKEQMFMNYASMVLLRNKLRSDSIL